MSALDDIKLISLVKEHAILYEKNADFHNKDKQQTAWTSIASSLGREVDDVKQKWTYLREKFLREKQNESSWTKATAVWELMGYLQFLGPVMKRRETLSNVARPKKVLRLSPVSQEIVEEHESATSMEMLSSESSCSSNDLETSPIRRRYPVKRRAAMEEPNPEQQMLASLNKLLSTIIERFDVPNNSEDAFGRLVASQLRLVEDKEKKIRIMREICNIIFK